MKHSCPQALFPNFLCVFRNSVCIFWLILEIFDCVPRCVQWCLHMMTTFSGMGRFSQLLGTPVRGAKTESTWNTLFEIILFALSTITETLAPRWDARWGRRSCLTRQHYVVSFGISDGRPLRHSDIQVISRTRTKRRTWEREMCDSNYVFEVMLLVWSYVTSYVTTFEVMLLVLKWSQAKVYFLKIYMKSVVVMSLWPRIIKILISNQPRTRKFSQFFKNTSKEDIFSPMSHSSYVSAKISLVGRFPLDSFDKGGLPSLHMQDSLTKKCVLPYWLTAFLHT